MLHGTSMKFGSMILSIQHKVNIIGHGLRLFVFLSPEKGRNSSIFGENWLNFGFQNVQLRVETRALQLINSEGLQLIY